LGVIQNHIRQGGTLFRVENLPLSRCPLHIVGFVPAQFVQGLVPVNNAVFPVQDEDRGGRVRNQALDKGYFLAYSVLMFVDLLNHGIEHLSQFANLVPRLNMDQTVFALLCVDGEDMLGQLDKRRSYVLHGVSDDQRRDNSGAEEEVEHCRIKRLIGLVDQFGMGVMVGQCRNCTKYRHPMEGEYQEYLRLEARIEWHGGILLMSSDQT
jgi:hypothetical protein